MATRNPIQYTSRTYERILADINSDAELVDKPSWFKRIWAGVGDVISMWNNSVANQAFLRTAFTKQAIVDHLEMLDYYLTRLTTASGIQVFNLQDSAVLPLFIGKDDLKASLTGGSNASSLPYVSRSNTTISSVTSTFTASAGTDLITIPTAGTWGYTGVKVKLSSSGTLPAGLSAQSYWLIYVSSTTFKLAASLADAVAGTFIDITGAGTGTHTLEVRAAIMTCYQQENKPEYAAGKSDGSSLWQEFNLVDLNLIAGTEVVTINAVVWTKVDTFVDSQPTDTHYRLLSRTDGTPYLRFGNGTYGAIPAAFDIMVAYATGGGTSSNVSTTNRVNSYAGADSNIEATFNATIYNSGAAEESTENAKRLAPILLKAQNRYITSGDGSALAKSYGGVARVKINRNYYGPLSAQVIVVPTGGGAPSPALISALQTYLINRSLFEEPNIVVEAPTYVAINFTSAFKPLSGYLYADVEPLYNLAVKLLFSEVTSEIIDTYVGSGIAEAVTSINSIFSTSFTVDDYENIQRLLDNVPLFDFGASIQQSDVLGFLDSFVVGVDYLTVASPSFPITFTGSQTSTHGTVTTTEIV